MSDESKADEKQKEEVSSDSDELYQNLLIHQAELEAQNSELKRAHNALLQAEQRYKTIFNVAPTGYCVVDRNGIVVDYNPQFASMMDRDQRSLEDVPLAAYVQDSNHQVFRLIEQTIEMANSTTHWTTASLRRSTGGSLPVRIGFTYYPNINRPLVMLSIADITRELEARTAHREALEAKTRFVANVSHEIRTPLHGVLGNLELMKDSQMDTQAEGCLESALTSAQVLKRVINDILDYSKLDTGNFEISSSELDLCALMETTVDSLKSLALYKGLTLSTKYPEKITRYVGDEVRIQQIVLNLLTNAIKFTDEGEICLEVEVRTQRKGSDLVAIKVTDSGRGMSPNQSAKLFRPFEQGQVNDAESLTGTGLGLSIVRELSVLMGGDVRVQSELGEGSEFTVTLLLQRCEINEPELEVDSVEPVNTEESLNGRRVLVVDDNEINLRISSLILNQCGAEANTAMDGEAALAILSEMGEQIDLILMDLQMPVMDGIETTQRLRSNPDWENIVVLGITANVSKDIRTKCLEAGMQAVITKPFLKEELTSIASQLIQSRARH